MSKINGDGFGTPGRGPLAALRQRAERTVQAAQGFEPDPVRGGYSTADRDKLNPVQRYLQGKAIDRVTTREEHSAMMDERRREQAQKSGLEDRLKRARSAPQQERSKSQERER